ncbi:MULTISPECIES: DUF4142 domain-containing protein [unclassified Mucilaginibacter]|uniref:DUF4142 domain-containing protein n=1 Tax=unclassified Mucilaginibacter TaxID=2617802 RepID=UPI002AC95CB6|nr:MULTISPECIES: DUF4142 domain-containing protein [unclassified Mucilaginibacter]MEB0261140.1 DUF4142 domain-containing protein [Mucilaginibacter sp. 10I4]MEB0280515.1 DUF4142 domain-containing protein [Mucilaginibacter sp. 10B2]MEB0301279.1 DUF4142 domain-containing protein [Mucilaginibacter sp. 5C4]WPX22489.1 DUF4142 domain-containing protein [Mucilaginibacter sp. 5C4]
MGLTTYRDALDFENEISPELLQVLQIQSDLNLKDATDSFNQMYVHAMVVNNRNTVQTFENYATTGKDANMKAFAKQMLPILKHHLEGIKMVDMQINSVVK